MIDIKPTKSKRIFGLDLLRAVAILMVLSSHCLWIYPVFKGRIAQFLALFGFYGVEIFYVLSGFLIGRILFQLFVNEEDFTINKVIFFLKRRWYRTLPNYFFALIVNFIIVFFIGYSIEEPWRYLFFIQNFSTTMLPFFPESWSLSIEEFAYLLFPIFLFVSFYFLKPKNKSKLFFISTLVLILFFIFTKYIYYQNTSNTTLQQWNISLKAVVIYRLDSIFIGILTSWLYFNFADFWKKYKLLYANIGIIFTILIYANIRYFHILIVSYPFFWNVIYLPATSISIAFFLPLFSEWKNTTSFLAKPITFVSKISYSVYLIHYSIVLQLMKFAIDTSNYTKIQLHIFTFVYLVITFLLSWILYRFYEKPMTDRRDKIVNQ